MFCVMQHEFYTHLLVSACEMFWLGTDIHTGERLYNDVTKGMHVTDC